MKRAVLAALTLAAACGSKKPALSAPPAPAPAPAPPHESLPPPHEAATPAKTETMTTDTPRTTATGTSFIAPGGWSVTTRGAIVIVASPEADSHVAFVDVPAKGAKDADAAVAAAWAAYDPTSKRKVLLATDQPARDGWEQSKGYQYETAPAEKRIVAVLAQRAADAWTVVIIDAAEGTAEKRGAQFGVLLGRILPKGGARETFAGKTAHALDAEHVKMLTDFVEESRKALEIPGVAIALVDHDKVVFEGGFGVRELGKPAAIDKDTRFIIASNTKALTTLLLARLVDQGKARWDTPVTELYPDFKLGDADTTKQVELKHLVCACTGLPRQDFEWLFEFAHATPLTELALLANIQPTSKFGEMFQYSNGLAAAAGFIAAHVLFPKKELGAAYDQAMREQVFGPLGMKDVTFDFKKALAGNHAGAYGRDLDGKIVPALFSIDYAAVPLRPAGGLWASVHDMIRYVRMELAEGTIDGKPYLGKDALLARRAPNVAVSKDVTYGMGLMVDQSRGVTVVHHGGDIIGYHSDMIWLPDQQVGAVILTNAEDGPTLVGAFRRRLLEVLFDGKPEAAENIATAVIDEKASLASARSELVIPADPTFTADLAAKYTNAALGDLVVTHAGKALVFDFGEWKTEVASHDDHDGTHSFVSIAPGIAGLTFVAMGSGADRTLVLGDAQHQYVFALPAKK
jgi:CubicO group peptidase (beta-lactamase class C family)